MNDAAREALEAAVARIDSQLATLNVALLRERLLAAEEQETQLKAQKGAYLMALEGLTTTEEEV